METPSRATKIVLYIIGLLTIAFWGIMTLIFAFISLAAFISIFTGDGAVGVFGCLGGAALAWLTGGIIYDTLKS
ncbi:MAG: hypothetical protein UF067_04095 [Paludibacteraceae bacterium]|nr:hypothetical protein [Paludibacteraceae bacterium]